VADADLAAIARLVGEPGRAAMLRALLDGRALTAGELARVARLSAPAASAHLGRLLDAGLVVVAASGRHRYYALAGHDVAEALEALAILSPAEPVSTLRASSAARALRPARLCYDHLAGELGVRVHDALVDVDGLRPVADGLALTVAGARWFTDAGVDLDGVAPTRRPALRTCMDWTERRFHLAGSLAAALASTWLDRGWLERRAPGERGLRITPVGEDQMPRLVPVASNRAKSRQRASSA
jgi:DNA-binding transcriptional ArsR family regulator